jgi:hypothetical protein
MVTSIPQLWPPPADFSLMLQNPMLAFKDPDLKTCQIARDANNQPDPRSGAFAVVYKGTYQAGASRKGNVAIRVFSSASSERQERYKAISEYLKKCPLKCLVDFEYLDKGILHGKSGKWYPLIRMEWVQGDILFNYARDRCLANDNQALSSLSDKWVEMIADLARARIAHGDLQHANVMVTDRGELKLVDYDCMCVPALEGRRNLELGVVPYQNPKRTDDTLLFSGLDNFSSLFIFVVLRALSAAPSLWDTFVEPPQGQLYDKLLIRDTDFQNPGQSELYRALQKSSDQKVRKLSGELFGLWNADLRDIPSLATLVNDFDKVRHLLTAKSFDEALALLNASKPISPPPKELQADIENAKQRVACRESLEQAVHAGDEQAIKRAYRPQLLDDYVKAAPAVEIARQADQAIKALDALQTAKSQQKWREFVQHWERDTALLAPRRSAAGFMAEVRHWKRSNEICDEVWRAFNRRPPDFLALQTAWTQLEKQGGHPETQAHKSKIEGLLRKYVSLSDFVKLKGPLSEQLDVTRFRMWREDEFAGWDEAERYRPDFEAAEKRIALCRELRSLVQRFPDAINIKSEQAIIEQFCKLPASYGIEESIKKRAMDARLRMQSYQLLQQATSQIPASDSAMGKAWHELAKLNGRDLVPTKHHARLDLASMRLPVLAELSQISLSLPLDQLDAAVLKAWNLPLLSEYESNPEFFCRDAEPWRIAHKHAALRRELIGRLEQALATMNASAVQQLSTDPLLKDYPLPEQLRTRITSSLFELNDIMELLNAIRSNDPLRFQQKFNADLVRRFPADFRPLENDLHRLLGSEILPIKKSGFRRIPGSVPIVERSYPDYIFDIQWGWPERRILDKVVVGICRGNPPEVPEAGKMYFSLTTDRQTLKQGTGMFVLPAKPEWMNGMVVVWGVIDLGFRQYFTEPFQIGRLSSRRAK